MKNKLVLTTLVSILFFIRAHAQSDSAKIEYSQEQITPSTRLEEAICDVLTKREKAEKDLWKLNLLGTVFGRFNIAYERKIASKYSFQLKSITDFNWNILAQDYSQGKQRMVFGSSGYNNINVFSQSFIIDIRYYYNYNKRLRLGKKVGFSGNYFNVELGNYYHVASGTGQRINYIDTTGIATISNYSWSSELVSHSLSFCYGIQRRFGKVGYVDSSIGFGALASYGHATYSSSIIGDNSGANNLNIGNYGDDYENYLVKKVDPFFSVRLAIGIAF